MNIQELPHPLIFAHRGASAYAPENTLAAFELALKQGAMAIELDVKLSADGEVIVIHDQTVDRTTNSHGRVAELTLDELRQLDAGSHFDICFQGEAIPTLAEVFESIGDKALINIELTNYNSPTDDLPQKVAELTIQYGLARHILYSSFNPIALRRIRKMIPEAPLGLLALPGPGGMLARSWFGRLVPYYSLQPAWRDISPRLVKRVHKRGCKVFSYTVNNAQNMSRLFNMGVDGVFTDDPVLALDIAQGINADHPDPRSTESRDTRAESTSEDRL